MARGGNKKLDVPPINGKAPGVEIYDRGRYFAVTGLHLEGTPRTIEPRQSVLDEFVATYWPAAQPQAGNGKPAPVDVAERAARCIAKIPGAVSEQGGHNQTYHVACVLVLGFGLTPEQALPILQRWNETCQPPWTEKELRHKLDDANKEGGPRGWLLDGRGYHGPDMGLSRLVSGEPTRQDEAADTDDRPCVVVTTDEYAVNCQALAVLVCDDTIFQRGGHLVHVVHDRMPRDGINRAIGTPMIAELPEPVLRERLTRNMRFIKQRRDEEGVTEIPAHPPQWCVQAIAQRGEWAGIRPLVAVVPTPILRPDGTIAGQIGYDARTGIYCSDDAGAVVPSHPTRDDAISSLKLLLDVVRDFPFASAEHQAAWVAFLLTPLARHAFDGPAPLFLTDANVPGSGKTLLCELVSLIVYGRDIARMPNPRDDEEARKRITAVAITGDPLLLLDNVSGRLGCPAMDAALTGTSWKDRLLSVNEIVDLPLRTVWCASGNNVMLAGDTPRRTVHIRLDSPLEKPELRTDFEHSNIKQHVKRHRQELLSAALTVLRAYFVAGKPQHGIPAWGSYEGWSAIVRETLVWAGLPDPAKTRQELTDSADTDATALRALLESWPDIDPDNQGLTTTEILDKLQDGNAYQHVRAAILESCPPGNKPLPGARQLGNRFAHIRRRVMSGKAMDYTERRARQRAWRLVRCGDSDVSGDSVCRYPRAQKTQMNAAHTDVDSVELSHQCNQSHHEAEAKCSHDWQDTTESDGKTRRFCSRCGQFGGFVQADGTTLEAA